MEAFSDGVIAIIITITIVSTFWVRWLALALYVLVALIWLIPDRRIEQALRRSET
jgi:TMEM175 potassium channel family protein